MKVVRWMGDLRHCSKARPTGLTGAGPCFRMAQIDGGMPAGEASHVQCASEASKLRGPFPSGLFFGWAACGTLSVMGPGRAGVIFWVGGGGPPTRRGAPPPRAGGGGGGGRPA